MRMWEQKKQQPVMEKSGQKVGGPAKAAMRTFAQSGKMTKAMKKQAKKEARGKDGNQSSDTGSNDGELDDALN